ncbi:sugar ABC transporter permease [Cohnella sp. LGH]|uniref:Raffinose/stachyose/melibiose transport system permease protein n=1 Tax=Cohnella phaseoli TaxID=456490 RepID=A0A3D9KG48_9BACL|nr:MULTISPECIES: sugar ABC transporter permease [Cohnella]QTH41599.1 sugar ABC transporter permease [Cohnella sp. LGH]RED85481.1 raffinose/stachyose/melibiose transport system permease protein [Cohnella phaseoli]
MRNKIWTLLFLVPALFFFIATVIYPLLYNFVLSFTNWDGYSMSGVRFIGWDNYRSLFTFPDLLQPFVNTLKFAVFTTVIQNLLQLLLALVLDSKLKTRSFARVAFYIPALLSGVVLSSIFTYLLGYNGALNEFLRSAGLESLVNDWFGNGDTALGLLMGINVWQWTGFGAIIYLAALQGIPTDYYEAAKIDGAGAGSRFRHITFPLLMPAVTILTFLGISGGLKLFELPFIITKGGPAGATNTIATFIFSLNAGGRVALACAISIVLMLFIALLTGLQLFVTRKREVEA